MPANVAESREARVLDHRAERRLAPLPGRAGAVELEILDGVDALDNANDQARVGEQAEDASRDYDPKPALREADDSLDSTELHARHDPPQATKEVRLHLLLLLRRIERALM